MRRADYRVALALALLPLVAPAGAASPADAAALAPLADVEWEDQLGGRDRLASHRGETVLLLVVEARRLPLAGKWAEALQARDPGLTLLTVADAPPDVPVDPARFAAMLRKRVPAGVRVWMDPGRSFARALGLDTAEPNLLLLGPDGAPVARMRGRATPALVDEVAAAAAALAPIPPERVP
ncbi:MAG: hypothetical protein JNM50_05680 [Chromatiales bacterium]|jgi:hypothetical protein|nr:hypothetical protein [Chromatiales bacterium]